MAITFWVRSICFSRWSRCCPICTHLFHVLLKPAASCYNAMDLPSYRDFHDKDKAVVLPAYIYYQNSYTADTTYLFWKRPPTSNSYSTRNDRPFQLRYWWPFTPWWRHQMETFSAILAICAGKSPASGDFPAQRPVTRSFDVCFDLCLNKRLRKQSRVWWFDTLSPPLWRNFYAAIIWNLYGRGVSLEKSADFF